MRLLLQQHHQLQVLAHMKLNPQKVFTHTCTVVCFIVYCITLGPDDEYDNDFIVVLIAIVVPASALLIVITIVTISIAILKRKRRKTKVVSNAGKCYNYIHVYDI